MPDKIIYSDDFTDENGNLHYFNTGRDNVSGLNYPTHYIRNKDNYSYTRILNIKLSQDTSLVYPLHECFLLTTYKDNNSFGLTNIINIDALVKNGAISYENIKVTCTPLEHSKDILGGESHEIKVAIKPESQDGNIVNTVGVWLNTNGIIDIIIKNLLSLAYDEIPNNIYHQFLQCDYEARYLNNEEVTYEVNMFMFEESIGTKIADSVNANQFLIDKVKKVSDNVQSAIPDYQFLTVIYDDMYSISDINIDEIINPTSFQYVEVGNSFAEIKENAIQVKETGNYIIALKVNMDIHDGMPSKLMMSLFLNDDRIEETTCTMYLNPSNKVYPLGFLAGQVQMQLKPSDKLYLKARWSDKDNVIIENHCNLQITKLNKIV